MNKKELIKFNILYWYASFIMNGIIIPLKYLFVNTDIIDYICIYLLSSCIALFIINIITIIKITNKHQK